METIIKFEGYEGLSVSCFNNNYGYEGYEVMRVYEGFEGKYLTFSCIYY